MLRRTALSLCLLTPLVGCDDEPGSTADATAQPMADAEVEPTPDGAPLDADPADAGPADAVPADALPIDALPADASPVDALPDAAPPPAYTCQRVANGYGPEGEVRIDVQVVADGLDVPWSIAWLPGGDLIVTERDGALLRIDPADPDNRVGLADVPVSEAGEGGLLGMALHPDFANNRWIYLYYTAGGRQPVNQVERWILAEDGQSTEADRIIVADIPARQFHNGGRLRFGPDGHLYIGTGDAGTPATSQDPNNLAGKILRVTDEGEIPADNPFPDSATWIYGIRNTQGFDWLPDGRMVVTDHGPSGIPNEGGRRGHDEITIAAAGDNLGWPDIYACEEDAGFLSPAMTWANAMPPGGAAIYRGDAIPEWQGDTFIGVLGFGDDIGHLHRIRFDMAGEVIVSETYLRGDFGRLRDVAMGPDGDLYVTSSGCDGRGSCGNGDVILRVSR